MPRAVLLRHLTADGGSHYDWLLAPGDGPFEADERVLLSYRVAERVDEVAPGQGFEAHRMVDHRWVYLEYEGAISRGRGRVERVAVGIWRPGVIEELSISGEIAWSGRAPVFFEGRRIDSDPWQFQISPPHGR